MLKYLLKSPLREYGWTNLYNNSSAISNVILLFLTLSTKPFWKIYKLIKTQCKIFKTYKYLMSFNEY